MTAVAPRATDRALETEAINALRVLSIDAVQAANSGHPGLPLGAAPMAYVLWTEFMNYNPQDPHWANRDRSQAEIQRETCEDERVENDPEPNRICHNTPRRKYKGEATTGGPRSGLAQVYPHSPGALWHRIDDEVNTEPLVHWLRQATPHCLHNMQWSGPHKPL